MDQSRFLRPGSPEIPAALRLASQASVALFDAATAGSHPVVVSLGDGPAAAYAARPDESSVYPDRWVTGFHVNALRGDAEGLDRLCRVRSDALRLSCTRSPEYSFLHMDALRAYRAGRADVVNLIMESLRATDPGRDDVYDRDWALFLVVPHLEVLMYVVCADAKFGEALARAVQAHKDYYSKTRDRSRDHRGWISLRLTALAAMGREQGLPLDVDSPYLALDLGR